MNPHDRLLDWRNPRPDARNIPFTVAEHVPRRLKAWAGPYVRIDQGREGACVGFGWTVELMSSPVRIWPPRFKTGAVDVANRFALDLYHDAQRRDEWPGENYDGSSVLGGAKAVQARGYMGGYRWAENVASVIDAVITTGPVVLGVPWFSSMYNTDGYGRVTVSGRVVGGHCITVTGYNPRWHGLEVLRWRNSWGPSYGVNGDAFVAVADVDRLLAGADETGPGEACVPIDRHWLASPREVVS